MGMRNKRGIYRKTNNAQCVSVSSRYNYRVQYNSKLYFRVVQWGELRRMAICRGRDNLFTIVLDLGEIFPSDKHAL